MNSTFTKVLTIVFGLGLLFFGLSKFISFSFMPVPNLPEDAANFMASLSATGYILPLVGILEIAIGLFLIVNRWVPFALFLLAPISINILLFHLCLDLPGLIAALIVVIINAILIYKHWKAYRPLFN